MNVNLFDQLKLLFREVSFIVGFIFMLIGGFFTFVIAGEVDFARYKYWFMSADTAKGYVEYVKETSVEEDEQIVYEFGFSFSDPETKEYFKGVSYDTDRQIYEGDSVQVEYLVSDPYTNRIEGMDSAMVPLWVFLLVLIFPTVGFLVTLSTVGMIKPQVDIIRNGVLTKAKLTLEEETNDAVNGETVMKFYFTYEVNGVKIDTTVSSHNFDEITDEPEEDLVYHKDRPKEALIVDDLPKSIRKKIRKQLG